MRVKHLTHKHANTHHTRCKDYCMIHCTAPTPHCSVFLSAFLYTPLKHLTYQHVIKPLLSNLDAWGELCGVEPCPDPSSIRHHWWSSDQDLCFWFRGSQGEASSKGTNPTLERCLQSSKRLTEFVPTVLNLFI